MLLVDSKKIFLFSALFSAFLSCDKNNNTKDGIKFEKDNWENTLAKAKAENKIVFVDAYTTWCGPCKKMDANTFPDKKVGDFYNKNFINQLMIWEIQSQHLHPFDQCYLKR